jgi:hypothetical protein
LTPIWHIGRSLLHADSQGRFLIVKGEYMAWLSHKMVAEQTSRNWLTLDCDSVRVSNENNDD